MPAPAGLSAKDKRAYMAKVFEKTQRDMSSIVDDLSLAKRSPVPYPSTYKGNHVAETGPIPVDAHLIPSGMTTVKSAPHDFEVDDLEFEQLGLSGKPWASYLKAEPSIFTPSAGNQRSSASPAARKRTTEEEEMWRAQYLEWTLQKNAFNPDIAAALRTNVRKQASLSIPPLDKVQDPARTSENVRAALAHSEITGPAILPPKSKVDPSLYRPNPMA
eukprot:CAMPEP_0174701118 /NCGR_PEP_ID=MMETSP1094-20130205/5859_1 /TAXON_ID=156173 /ORGANISM="Chrysochromulina brevifilum, Strain UTEX LB 985" /LENGTH=216 /DNA_ID=CAMNT_0015898717 /DNA_START=32 /DNA_END=682 /DNA_ORIENTATION=+